MSTLNSTGGLDGVREVAGGECRCRRRREDIADVGGGGGGSETEIAIKYIMYRRKMMALRDKEGRCGISGRLEEFHRALFRCVTRNLSYLLRLRSSGNVQFTCIVQMKKERELFSISSSLSYRPLPVVRHFRSVNYYLF